MAYDWERRLDQRCSSIDQKLDELEGLLRAFAATRRITSAPAQGMGQIQPCDRVEDRTLYIKIHLEEFLISWEILDQVFSTVGKLELIEIFDNNAQFHSRIRFQNRDSAVKAFNCYNGRCIYNYCCRMELFVDESSEGRGQDQDQSGSENFGAGPSDNPKEAWKPFVIELHTQQEEICSIGGMETLDQKRLDLGDLGVPPSDKAEEIEIPSSHMVNSSQHSFLGTNFERQVNLGVTDSDNHVEQSEGKTHEAPPKEFNWETRDRSFLINSGFRGDTSLLHLEFSVFGDCSWVSKCEKHFSSGGNFDAQHVFEEMPLRGSNFSEATTQHNIMFRDGSNGIFDPGGNLGKEVCGLKVEPAIQSLKLLLSSIPVFGWFDFADRGNLVQLLVQFPSAFAELKRLSYPQWCSIIVSSWEYGVMVIPLGNYLEFITVLLPYDRAISSGVNVIMKFEVLKARLVFDPGGKLLLICVKENSLLSLVMEWIDALLKPN